MRVAILALVLFAVSPALSQELYPNRPIRIVVPFTPGGTTDILARLLGAKLSERLGVSVIVDNRPGASNLLGTNEVAKSKPDGYTLGLFISTHAINPFVLSKLPYDTKKGFAPVTIVARHPVVLVAGPSVKAKNLSEVIELAKAKPGEYTYGVPATRGFGHVTMEYLKQLAGIDIRLIPYKGASGMITDLIAGRIDFSIGGAPPVLPYIEEGRLKAIATTGGHRAAILPDVPTVAESGFSDLESYEWYALFAPANVPEEVLTKLNAEFKEIIALPQVKQRLLELGVEPVGSSAEALSSLLDTEMAKWRSIAKDLQLAE